MEESSLEGSFGSGTEKLGLCIIAVTSAGALMLAPVKSMSVLTIVRKPCRFSWWHLQSILWIPGFVPVPVPFHPTIGLGIYRILLWTSMGRIRRVEVVDMLCYQCLERGSCRHGIMSALDGSVQSFVLCFVGFEGQAFSYGIVGSFDAAPVFVWLLLWSGLLRC